MILSVLSSLRPHSTSGSAPEGLGLILGIGIPVVVLSILAIVLTAVRSSTKKQLAAGRARAAQEGVVLDAGSVWMTVRYRGFRTSNVAIGIGLRMTKAVVILTRERLMMLPASRHYFDIAVSDFGRFTVGLNEKGELHIRTESPPNASGSLEYAMGVPEPPAWVSALADAGMQRG